MHTPPTNTEEDTMDAHLTSEEVAAYLAGAPEGAELERLDAHMVACDACRAEVVAVRRVVQRRRKRRWGPLPLGGLAAAALAGVFFLTPGTATNGESGDPVLRDAQGLPAEGVATIEVVTPEDGSQVLADSLRFEWRPLVGDVMFVVTVSDENGDVVWTSNTLDTVLAMDPGIPLRPNRRYFLIVDALIDGAWSASSRMLEFSVRR